MDNKDLIGKTIKIENMSGEPQYAGRTGTVELVDDMGQLHGTWGGLAVVPGEDCFSVVEPRENQLSDIVELLNNNINEWELESGEVCELHLCDIAVDRENDKVILGFNKWSEDLEEVINEDAIDLPIADFKEMVNHLSGDLEEISCSDIYDTLDSINFDERIATLLLPNQKNYELNELKAKQEESKTASNAEVTTSKDCRYAR